MTLDTITKCIFSLQGSIKTDRSVIALQHQGPIVTSWGGLIWEPVRAAGMFLSTKINVEKHGPWSNTTQTILDSVTGKSLAPQDTSKYWGFSRVRQKWQCLSVACPYWLRNPQPRALIPLQVRGPSTPVSSPSSPFRKSQSYFQAIRDLNNLIFWYILISTVLIFPKWKIYSTKTTSSTGWPLKAGTIRPASSPINT